MQKTYKCKNGHKFKREETSGVMCPTCNESAELVKWKSVDQFSGASKSVGIIEELGSAISEIPGGTKAVKVLGYLKITSLFKK